MVDEVRALRCFHGECISMGDGEAGARGWGMGYIPCIAPGSLLVTRRAGGSKPITCRDLLDPPKNAIKMCEKDGGEQIEVDILNVCVYISYTYILMLLMSLLSILLLLLWHVLGYVLYGH